MTAPASKRLLVVAILIFLVGDALCAYYASKCNTEVVTTCLQPLKDVDYPVADSVVPYMDKDTLKDHCRRYEMFEVCMQDVRPYCSTTEQLVYKGIESAYEWMCKDGFDDYLSYQKCFENTELHSEGNQCNITLTSNLQKIKTSLRDNDYKKTRICLYVKQYLDCVSNTVEAFCGSKAALWQRTLDEKSMFPLLEAIGCHITTTINSLHLDWIQISIGCVLTISILIIIVSVLVLFMRRRKLRQRTSYPDVAIPTAPPPYEEPGPFIVGASANQADAVSLPVKVNLSQTLPPYPGHAQGPSPDDEAVATGYFSATLSSPPVDHVPVDESKKQAASTENVTKNESEVDPSVDVKTFKTYEERYMELGGSSHPTFEEFGAVGYFGTAPSAQNDNK